MAEEFIAAENGSIKISEEVVVKISSISAKEVDGIVGLIASGGTIGEFLGKKNQNKTKGIKVEMSENSTEIDIHVVVRFGVKVCDVARKVQESVRFALESYVGLDNITVNVFVDAIDMSGAAAANNEEPEKEEEQPLEVDDESQETQE